MRMASKRSLVPTNKSLPTPHTTLPRGRRCPHDGPPPAVVSHTFPQADVVSDRPSRLPVPIAPKGTASDEAESSWHSSWRTLSDVGSSQDDNDNHAGGDNRNEAPHFDEALTFQRSPPKLTPSHSLISLMIAHRMGQAGVSGRSSSSSSAAAAASSSKKDSGNSTSPRTSRKSSAPTEATSRNESACESGDDEDDDGLHMAVPRRGIDCKPNSHHAAPEAEPARRPERRTPAAPALPPMPYRYAAMGNPRDKYSTDFFEFFLEIDGGFHSRGW